MLTDDLNEQLNIAKKTITAIRGAVDCDKLKGEIDNLQKLMESPGFYNDQKNAAKVSKEFTRKNETLNQLKKFDDGLRGFIDILESEDGTEFLADETFASELFAEIKEFNEKAKEYETKLLLNGKYDLNNAIVSIQAGAGGTESCDWAEMLLRMLQMFCTKNGYKFSLISAEDGGEAGIKSATLKVEGDFAYGYLKNEKGVHRLVRNSPFDSAGRRHTSFASIEVMPEIEQDGSVVIDPKDLRIDTYRSGGAGGQHVNKTESACRITHLPTGIVVTCQNERSLIQNRETAMQMLISKLLILKEENNKKDLKELAGTLKKIEWGSQIRSYVFCPYTLVKDHRTNYEETNVSKVMDGGLMPFMISSLQQK